MDQLQPAIENEDCKIINDLEKQCLLLQIIDLEECPQPLNNKLEGILMFCLNCFRLTPSALFERSGTYLNTRISLKCSFGTDTLQLFHCLIHLISSKF
jgi:hypothetical protein